MFINRRFSRRTAIVLVLLLLFTPFSSVFANSSSAGSSPLVSTMQDAMKLTAAEKIDSTVTKAFEADKFVSVIVELTDQVDTEKVAAAAKQSLGSNSITYDQKMAARYAVVNTLRATAETTQAPLISILEVAQADGEVKSFESFYIMNVLSVTATKDIINKLSYLPEVARITENETIDLVFPEKSSEPMTYVTDDGVEWNIDRVQAPDVWSEFGVTGEGIVVGVIDTGVQWDHPALMENFRGFDPANPNNPDPIGNWFDGIGNNSLPFDNHGHGTHVTGTVMGQDSSGDNKIGVAPGAQWIAAAGCSTSGCPQDALIGSAEYMLAPNGDPSLAPDIVQNSWGGQPGINEWYRPLVQAWRSAGMLPVFSAGNSGPGSQTVTPPANYPESYAVAATDNNNAVASFSSRGPANYDGDQKPNISAPGVNIRSSVPGGGYEGGWNGTSMASPHISGVAALLLSVNAALSPDELEEIMNETAIPLTDGQYTEVPNDGYGIGLVNAFDAVAMIADGLGFISGQVLKEGTDDEPPSIEHTPVDFGFSGLDIEVFATVSDNVAVTRTEVIVSHEDLEDDVIISMSRISGNHLDGDYRGVIPYMFVQEPGFSYQIVVEDFGGNIVTTDEFFVEIEFGVLPGEYSQDFENYPVGWITEGSWQWGEPTAGPSPVVGSKVIATNLTGNYPNNAADLLLLPPFDLRNTDEASLRMNHWYDIENNWDNGYVGVTADFGETWEIVEHFTGRDQQWRNLFVDLNPYAGSDTPVFVAFEFTSDGSVAYPGWYLDNMELVGEDTEAPDVPANLTAESSSVGISLAWEASIAPDVNGYRVYKSTTSGSDYEVLTETSDTFFTDTDVEVGLEYFYVVTAFDYSNNESDYSNEAFAGAPNIEVIFHTDFDADDGGFTIGGENNSWAWGTPTNGPGAAYAGENLWATNLTGNYNNNEDSWIMSPEIELSADLATAELTFSYWQNIENNWDNGYVEVSTDGGDTWDTLRGYTNIHQYWQTDSVSLNNYIGETIQFRFALNTDGSVVRVGWYIDNVYVLGGFDDTNVSSSVEPMKRVSLDTSKEKVEAKTALDHKIQKDPTSYDFELRSPAASLTSINGLPLAATVTILETNRTTRTNPIDGSYTLRASAGETVTLRAEAYGFYPTQASVTVEEDTTVIQNFKLEPLPSGSIEGSVTNSRTADGISGASLRLLEDSRIPGVTTDSDGNFTFDEVLIGDYTVRVTADGYNPAEVEVTVTDGEITALDVALTPFIGYEDEIAYDNGVADNAVVLNSAGNGLGVKFTPDDMTEVRGVSLYIWDDSWPVPGGNEISIIVYDTDTNGNPTNMVGSPVSAVVDRGGWNYIDLTSLGFTTDRDFFISTLQEHIGDLSPGVGTDMDGTGVGRSYLYVGGAFEQNTQYGNFMIRANVAYSLDAPVISTPSDMTYTKEDIVEVSGTTNADSTVNIYVDGELATSVETEGREFTATVELSEGENVITATSEVEQGETDPSAPITVVKDSIAPEVTITSPVDGDVTNTQVVTVIGTADDENLSAITVNGSSVDFDETGAFSKQLIVEEGENTFEVVATDLADNSTTETVSITVDWTAPTIENVTPSENVTVAPGETVTVSFESDSEGGDASFTVSLPSAISTNSAGVPMTEVSPGVYEGTWTAPEATFENAVITITMTDTAGNTSTATADGKISVVPAEEEEPPAPEPVTAEELYDMVNGYEASGEISRQAANQFRVSLNNAVRHYENGRTRQALQALNQFISRIDGNHMRNASPEVKAALHEAAASLYEAWSN
ncbi:S8 family serine peptidase [Evansella sp. AB-rgal1]|uniref:S8 family serine peptidase n=1 Tax=Evansella sp. AB-rgal1 TaxID=3242696 RepID=UPI00359E1BB4